MKYAYPFYVVRNQLTDGSVLFEVRAQNIDVRIGSSSDEQEAQQLASDLGTACTTFVNRTIDNTIDV